MISYCTNVHAGTTLAACMSNLELHATAVRAKLGGNEPLGVGLWLAADAAQDAATGDGTRHLRDFLDARGLAVRTFNGFPFGNFHAQKVKHAVYQPTWAEESRLRYTLNLAEILAQLLPEGEDGSISTLPLGWPPANEAACGKNLALLAEGLARLHQRSGRLIRVALEPEPGCAFDTAPGAARFFEAQLNDPLSRRHLGVCHDVCHSAVMFEPQAVALQTYRDAGIKLVKIQLSSAVSADFSTRCPEAREEMRRQLAAFAEDRYLHQTVVKDAAGRAHFFEDLPLALAAAKDEHIASGSWRVHFHVPLFLERFGLLDTTQDEITQCLNALAPGENPHLEVETYAWGVLPEALKPANLAEGIAKEIEWAKAVSGGSESNALADVAATSCRRPTPSFRFLNPETSIARHDGHRLPHWFQEGATTFVTFRTADALPAQVIEEWRQKRETWLCLHPKPWTEALWVEHNRLFAELDHRMDQSHGQCHLKRSDLRQIVESALRHFDGQRYDLDTFVIMPNHVHAVVTPYPGESLSKILQSWKSFSAKAINRTLGSSGTFWQKESYDHLIRSSEELHRIRRYIEKNPAHLGIGTFTLRSTLSDGDKMSPLHP